MENQKGLTNREKKLLIFLAVFAFTAAMVMLVIMPLNNRLFDERATLGDLRVEKMRIDTLLARDASIRQNNQAAIQAYQDVNQRLLSESHISEIGRMLTRICQEHSLMPIDQRLTEPVRFGEGDALLIVSATMTVGGTYGDLKRLLNTVGDTEYLRVNGVSFSIAQDEQSEQLRISLGFEVIMIREFV